MAQYRWHLPAAAVFVAALTLIAWQCTGSNSDTGADSTAPVPRPTAYPRIDTYPATYTNIELRPLIVQINDSAVAEIDTVGKRQSANGQWLSIHYPRYNATIYCTLTNVNSTQAAIATLANREERMAMNTGGATTQITELINTVGFSCKMLVTPYGTVTPVQFIATDSASFALSGTLHMQQLTNATANDSIAPIINAVETDVLHLLQSLKHNQ
jgi:hypothetical protein